MISLSQWRKKIAQEETRQDELADPFAANSMKRTFGSTEVINADMFTELRRRVRAVHKSLENEPGYEDPRHFLSDLLYTAEMIASPQRYSDPLGGEPEEEDVPGEPPARDPQLPKLKGVRRAGSFSPQRNLFKKMKSEIGCRPELLQPFMSGGAFNQRIAKVLLRPISDLMRDQSTGLNRKDFVCQILTTCIQSVLGQTRRFAASSAARRIDHFKQQ